jgi:hypothetical protein
MVQPFWRAALQLSVLPAGPGGSKQRSRSLSQSG